MAKEKNPAISVIIPMYNAEKYLEECLDSLLNQTMKDFEVIVVNDCSTDKSLEIAERYMNNGKWQHRFAVIQMSKNCGRPGIARNFGIDAAKGKYIYFLDSDDFIDETVLETLYFVAEKFNADVVHAKLGFEYKEIDGKFQNAFIDMETADMIEEPTLETSNIGKRIETNIAYHYTLMVWSKIFRREFLIENDIKFPAIACSEDHIFSTMALICAKNYVRMPFIGYHYRRHSGSVTRTKPFLDVLLLDLIEGFYFLDNFLQKQKFFTENPTYRYLTLDNFYQMFAPLISKNIFFKHDFEIGEAYNFYREIFSINPPKNLPLISYLFASTNIYKMLVQQQATEIEQLKNALSELQKK